MFAEQVAPFLDTFLLGAEGSNARDAGVFDALRRRVGLGAKKRGDRERYPSRMHE